MSFPEVRTLWIGDLEPWMDENYLHSIFNSSVNVIQVKVIRDKQTGVPAGYGFVEFETSEHAKHVLENYNGCPLPNGNGKTFRLNWATYGINEKRPDKIGPEFSIFVGDLSPEVTDYTLQKTFATNYPSVKSAKVVFDPQTGASRGYGFVRFSNEDEMKRAMLEMQGKYCGSRPIRINAATPKRNKTITQSYATPSIYQPPIINQAGDDGTNTTIFIGGLDPSVDEDTLRKNFCHFGEVVYVKIPPGMGCGFVSFLHRTSAEDAFSVHGNYIGKTRVRLSWGRSSASVASNAPPTNTPLSPVNVNGMHNAVVPLPKAPAVASRPHFDTSLSGFRYNASNTASSNSPYYYYNDKSTFAGKLSEEKQSFFPYNGYQQQQQQPQQPPQPQQQQYNTPNGTFAPGSVFSKKADSPAPMYNLPPMPESGTNRDQFYSSTYASAQTPPATNTTNNAATVPTTVHIDNQFGFDKEEDMILEIMGIVPQENTSRVTTSRFVSLSS